MNQNQMPTTPLRILIALAISIVPGPAVSAQVTLTEQAKLLASDGQASDYFGWAVSVSDDTVVMGAYRDDDNGSSSGSAYVFYRTGTAWTEQAKLLASDGAGSDWFGHAVSVCGDTVVVGAPWDDDSGYKSGSAYVFVRKDTTWTQQAKLLASDGANDDWFGFSISMSDDTVIVGAVGDQDHGTDSGSAYVFVRNGTTWTEEAKLLASDGAKWDDFGCSVAVSGGTALVGAIDSGSTTTGSAYVFVRNGTTWTEEAKLLASDGAGWDELGGSVSVSGDTALVGSIASGENGAAYVFVRNGTTWTEEAKLEANDGAASDYFGSSVSVEDDMAVIGARCNDVYGSNSGSAYVFTRNGTAWTERAKLLASDGAAHDWLGYAASISGGTVVVGAPFDDNPVYDSGSTYLFTLSEPGIGFCFGDPNTGTPCPCGNDNSGSIPGSGCANGVFTSGAQLTGHGLARVSGDTLGLTAKHLEPNNFGLYFQADNNLSPGNVWGDGLRCAGGNLRRLQVRMADALGTSYTTVDISTNAGNVSSGDTKYYQCWYRNLVNSPCGFDFNTSNGYAVTWTP